MRRDITYLTAYKVHFSYKKYLLKFPWVSYVGLKLAIVGPNYLPNKIICNKFKIYIFAKYISFTNIFLTITSSCIGINAIRILKSHLIYI